MGTLVGHVVPGIGFVLIGLWHLCNHIKFHCQYPKSFKSPTWFPFPRVRHLELYFILFGSLTYLFTELVLGPSRHNPFDSDWSIPTTHLHNFEHATITLAMLIYALFALRLDRVHPRAGRTLAFLLGATTFMVELLVFYVHSTDHSGLEGQYHWLLQTCVAASVSLTLLGIGHPGSFAVDFTRSVSVVFQGVWFIVLGIMLYTPRLIPKGCHLESKDGFLIIPCDGPASLHRGKALANLQFAWSFITVVAFSAWFYLHMAEKFPEVTEHEGMGKVREVGEFPKSPKRLHEQEKTESLFLDVGKCFEPMELERK